MKSRLRGRRNTRATRVLFVALLIVPLLGTPLAPSPFRSSTTRGDELTDAYNQQQALQKQIAKQKALLGALKSAQADTAAAIKATTARLDDVNADLASVKADIKKATAELAAATKRYYELVEQVKLLHAQLLWLQATLEQKEAELRARQLALAQRLETAYQESHSPMLAQLLGSGSLNDALVTISYFLTMGEQDRELAERVMADQQVLGAMETTVSQLRDQTVSLRDETAAQKAALAKQRQELKEAQAKLKKLQDQVEALLAKQRAAYRRLAASARTAANALEAQRRAEADLSTRIKGLMSRYRIPSAYNGSLNWPMEGTVTQEFGCTGFEWEPALGSCAHFHRGIDIAAPYGRAIHAAGAGTVIWAGRSPTDIYGAYIVIIAHSERLTSWYAHVKTTIPVRAGQHVRGGQIIAYEGTTGLSTGPHLHWAVQLDSVWVNPRLFL